MDDVDFIEGSNLQAVKLLLLHLCSLPECLKVPLVQSVLLNVQNALYSMVFSVQYKLSHRSLRLLCTV